MPYLARHLQESFLRDCPPGWVCRTEVRVVPRDVEELLGYAPHADALLQEVDTGRRVWVEFEVSRADPVANHAKFATAHLFAPLPATDSFISMVSRHILRGRSNLSAHAIGLMRAIGIRAFQTPLLPAMTGPQIKRLNHLPIDRLREEPLGTADELKRVMSVSAALGRALDSDIHFAANAVEVIYNIRRWNRDIANPAQRELWGRRRVRYFACDPRTGLFAPSKFAAYLILPSATAEWGGKPISLTGMTIESYAQIDQQHPLFDGNRAWHHLQENLGMTATPLNALEAATIDSFWRWAESTRDAITVDSAGPVILSAPPWSF